MVVSQPPEVELFSADKFYGEFLMEEKDAGKPGDVSIGIVFGQVPDISGMPTLLEGEQSWSMFRSGGDRIIRFDRQDTGRSYMLVRFDPKVETVRVFCSDEFVVDGVSTWNPVLYPVDLILLMYYLSARSGAIVHASGMVIDGRGFLFAGRSGAGKTTISKRFALRKGVRGLSDDRIIVRKTEESFAMFGTPWPGDAGIAVNKSALLSGIFFLVQSGENRVERITGAEAFRRFMPVLSIPWHDKEAIKPIFSFVEELTSRVSSYLLYFTPDIEVEDLLNDLKKSDTPQRIL
jgi:hypothetical protein